MTRPPVSVVVPFAGTTDRARELRATLAALRVREDDELIVADNSPAQSFLAVAAGGPATAVAATGERSSYHARNVGAGRASRPWILFLDDDCRPPADLLDELFTEPPADADGALMGRVVGVGSDAIAARYARHRGFLGQDLARSHPYGPYAPTAALLVRAEAFDAIGGFCEGIRSGGDVDLCWRLGRAGWRLAFRERPVIEHVHRERVSDFVRQRARYAAGHRWLNERYPGSFLRPGTLRPIARSLARAARGALGGDLDRARLELVDVAAHAAEGIGYRLDNRVR